MILKSLKIRSKSDQIVDTQVSVQIANSFITRLVGLLGRKNISDNQALHILPCASIHTFGMRFSIDVVFLDINGRVVGFADNVKPNRIRFAPPGGISVIEVAEGNRSKTGINLDDYLIFD